MPIGVQNCFLYISIVISYFAVVDDICIYIYIYVCVCVYLYHICEDRIEKAMPMQTVSVQKFLFIHLVLFLSKYIHTG